MQNSAETAETTRVGNAIELKTRLGAAEAPRRCSPAQRAHQLPAQRRRASRQQTTGCRSCGWRKLAEQPWSTAGARQRRARSSYLHGAFAPVAKEVLQGDLPVEGALPSALDGTYARIGPNAKFPAAGDQHWCGPMPAHVRR